MSDDWTIQQAREPLPAYQRAEELGPLWRLVLNTVLKYYGNIERANAGAVVAGYPFYSWNGLVYHTGGSRFEAVTVTEIERVGRERP